MLKRYCFLCYFGVVCVCVFALLAFESHYTAQMKCSARLYSAHKNNNRDEKHSLLACLPARFFHAALPQHSHKQLAADKRYKTLSRQLIPISYAIRLSSVVAQPFLIAFVVSLRHRGTSAARLRCRYQCACINVLSCDLMFDCCCR